LYRCRKHTVELIHRTTPYPLVLVGQHGDTVGLSLAHKRWSQGEAGKTVLDDEVVAVEWNQGTDERHESDFLVAIALERQRRERRVSGLEQLRHGAPCQGGTVMKKLTADDPETKSPEIVADNIERLKAMFPELVTEGPGGALVNVDVLKQLVGDKTVTDAEEKYGLNWHGKRRARQIALTPSTGTLRPCPEDSVDWDTTQNLMIEGDNLEVLKLLQKSYAGKVKLIYIDPPYNTGKDFVYPDDFQDNIRNYMELTGQVDGEGRKISSNTEASGRFHTDWLNMMYPRLKLARNLLRDDGLLFISIDDNEIDNLIKVCGEIFGEENLCGIFIWEKKKKPSFLNANMGSITDYIICFAKSRPDSPPFAAGTVEDGKMYPFNNAGNGIQTLTFPAGSVKFCCGDQTVSAQDMSEGNIKTELLNTLVIKDGRNANAFRLRGEWRYSQQKLDEFVGVGAEIVIRKLPFRPNYVNRSGELKKTANLLSHRTNNVPTNEDATEEIRSLFGADVMSHPKPSGLLKYLVRTVTAGKDIILDFFAGSGTTAHGTWLQNVDDDGQRRFILVQLPEILDPTSAEAKPALAFCQTSGLQATIAEICKERLRRSAKSLQRDLLSSQIDLGFRVFKLDSSNIRAWKPDRDDLEKSLFAATEHIKSDRTEQDVLFELLLKLGLDLCVPIAQKTIAGKTVHSVGAGVLLVCLVERIATADVEPLALGIVAWHAELARESDSTVVFRDSAFADDVAKINLTAILQQHGLENVRSI
jgi:adenine-specific DNA-methyltransferase